MSVLSSQLPRLTKITTNKDSNMDENIIQYLQEHTFSRLQFEHQLKIKENGRPTPKLNMIQTTKAGGSRSFNEENYARTEWLAGSDLKLFCWPCILFDESPTPNPWISIGFDDLKKNLQRAMERHGKSKSHINSNLKLKLFGRVRIDEALSQAASIATQCHNGLVRRNREILRKIIIAVVYLGKQEQAFRGHNESAG